LLIFSRPNRQPALLILAEIALRDLEIDFMCHKFFIGGIR